MYLNVYIYRVISQGDKTLSIRLYIFTHTHKGRERERERERDRDREVGVLHVVKWSVACICKITIITLITLVIKT